MSLREKIALELKTEIEKVEFNPGNLEEFLYEPKPEVSISKGKAYLDLGEISSLNVQIGSMEDEICLITPDFWVYERWGKVFDVDQLDEVVRKVAKKYRARVRVFYSDSGVGEEFEI